MRVETINGHVRGDKYCWGMKVQWQQVSRELDEIVWSVPIEDADLVSENVESMLLASYAPAMLLGEHAIDLPREPDGLLVDCLQSANFYIRHWSPEFFPDGFSFPSIQFRRESIGGLERNVPKRVGAFFSGGVDSFYMIQRNLDSYPPGHPERVSYCIFVHGFDLGWSDEKGMADELFNEMACRMNEYCQAHGIRFVRVWTNLRQLKPEAKLWGEVVHLGALSSVAHIFSTNIDVMLLASGGEPLIGGALPEPYGGHPMLVQYFSSRAIRVLPQWPEVGRTERVKQIMNMEGVERLLHVCFRYWLISGEALNCGVCEKCIRTKLNILASGHDIPLGMFQNSEINTSLVDELYIAEPSLARFYYEILTAFEQNGWSSDITRALRRRMHKYEVYWRWRTGGTFRAKLRRRLSQIFGGT